MGRPWPYRYSMVNTHPYKLWPLYWSIMTHAYKNMDKPLLAMGFLICQNQYRIGSIKLETKLTKNKWELLFSNHLYAAGNQCQIEKTVMFRIGVYNRNSGHSQFGRKTFSRVKIIKRSRLIKAEMPATSNKHIKPIRPSHPWQAPINKNRFALYLRRINI